MVLNSSAMFVNVFTGIGMKLDNFQNATLGNWSMLGYLIGGIATIWLSVKAYTSNISLPPVSFYWGFPPCSCISRYKVQDCTNG